VEIALDKKLVWDYYHSYETKSDRDVNAGLNLLGYGFAYLTGVEMGQPELKPVETALAAEWK